MSEQKPSVDEILQRIDQLLNVLNLISRDLTEILKLLRNTEATLAAPIPASPTEKLRSIKDVQTLFPEELENLLIFEDREEHIIIRPRRYLGSDNFAKVASIVRDVGGEYVSAGKESHFKLPKEKE